MTNRTMIPGSEHAFTFKTLADAFLLRNHIIERFERADVEPDPRRKRRLLTFVVIGGGLVGVELFGELTAFVDEITPLYRHVSRDEVRLLLLQGGNRIMPEIDTKLADYGARVLGGRRGAEIRTHAAVRAIEPGKVHLPDETIEAETIVLAARIVPNPVVAGLPVEKDKRGHIVVDGTMRCKSHPEVWALGDCAVIPAPDGKPYPNLAQHALREAKVLARNIHGVLDGRPPQPFVYQPRPSGPGWPPRGERPRGGVDTGERGGLSRRDSVQASVARARVVPFPSGGTSGPGPGLRPVLSRPGPLAGRLRPVPGLEGPARRFPLPGVAGSTRPA
jgi:NADH dehydrogenase